MSFYIFTITHMNRYMYTDVCKVYVWICMYIYILKIHMSNIHIMYNVPTYHHIYVHIS